MRIEFRVFKEVYNDGRLVDYSIGEAYYDDEGRIFAWTINEPIGTSGCKISDTDGLGDLECQLGEMLQTLKLPVLDVADLPDEGAVNFFEELEKKL